MIQQPHPRRRNPLAIPLVVSILTTLGLGAALAFVATAEGEAAAPAPVPVATTASPTPTVATVRMKGTMSMPQYQTPRTEYDTPNWKKIGRVGCKGVGGYDDIVGGASVTAYNSAGDIIGTSSLGGGVAVGKNCMFPFEVTGLEESDFYQVEVSHRGKVTVAKANLDYVGLSLG